MQVVFRGFILRMARFVLGESPFFFLFIFLFPPSCPFFHFAYLDYGEFDSSFSFSPTHVRIIVALVIAHCENNLTILISDQVGVGIFVVVQHVATAVQLFFVSK